MGLFKCASRELLAVATLALLSGCGAESGEPVAEAGQAVTGLTGGNLVSFYSGLLPDNRGRDHFYTADANEINTANSNGWAYEGIRFSVVSKTGSSAPTGVTPEGQTISAVPLLRYWSAGASDHFYTADPTEGSNTLSHGYVVDQPGTWNVWVFNQRVLGSCPVYRSYMPNLGLIDHFYTMSPSEYIDTSETEYIREGVRFYAFPRIGNSFCPG